MTRMIVLLGLNYQTSHKKPLKKEQTILMSNKQHQIATPAEITACVPIQYNTLDNTSIHTRTWTTDE